MGKFSDKKRLFLLEQTPLVKNRKKSNKNKRDFQTECKPSLKNKENASKTYAIKKVSREEFLENNQIVKKEEKEKEIRDQKKVKSDFDGDQETEKIIRIIKLDFKDKEKVKLVSKEKEVMKKKHFLSKFERLLLESEKRPNQDYLALDEKLWQPFFEVSFLHTISNKRVCSIKVK